MRDKTLERVTAAKAIRVASIVAMIAVGWQAVRFIMGEVGNPVVPVSEFVIKIIGEVSGLPPEALRNWYQSYMVWGFGIAAWVSAALLVGTFGKVAARVVLVGGKQYRAEGREAGNRSGTPQAQP